MKIILECLTGNESGPVFTLGVAKGLVDNGVDICALLTENIENKEEWEKLLTAKQLFFWKDGLSIRKHPIALMLEYLRLWNHFKHIKFDYWLDTFPKRKSLKVYKFLRCKESISIDHDAVPHSSAASNIAKETDEVLRKIDNVLVLSKQFIPQVKEKFGLDDRHVLYMRHGAMEYPRAVLNKEVSDNNIVNFLYFGRIDGYKGLHVLSEAYNDLFEQYSNISLTVAGNGDFSEYKDEYDKISSCTVVNKYLSDDDIAYYFGRKNTVLVLPYLDATQSGVIGMAFNYKTPVIVSDTGGLKEQMFDGEMGLYVEPGNVQDLKEKMEAFIINKDLFSEQVNLMESGYRKSTWSYVTKELIEQLERKQR